MDVHRKIKECIRLLSTQLYTADMSCMSNSESVFNSYVNTAVWRARVLCNVEQVHKIIMSIEFDNDDWALALRGWENQLKMAVLLVSCPNFTPVTSWIE